jgi:hypothetical protein
MSSRQIQRLCWLVVLVAVPACDKNGLSRVPVRGNVTYDGAPVERGMVTFRPASGSKGPAAGATIIDGEFIIAAEKGPTVGPHEVEIKIASVAKDVARPDEPALALRGNMQFKTFYQHVDVSTGINEFHFSFTPDATPARH